MPQIQLNDQIFEVAQRRASDAGYASVEEYIADVLVHDASDETVNLDHLFTRELLCELDQLSNEMKSGKSASMEEVAKHLTDVRDA